MPTSFIFPPSHSGGTQTSSSSHEHELRLRLRRRYRHAYGTSPRSKPARHFRDRAGQSLLKSNHLHARIRRPAAPTASSTPSPCRRFFRQLLSGLHALDVPTGNELYNGRRYLRKYPAPATTAPAASSSSIRQYEERSACSLRGELYSPDLPLNPPYTGWIMGYNPTLAQTTFSSHA